MISTILYDKLNVIHIYIYIHTYNIYKYIQVYKYIHVFTIIYKYMQVYTSIYKYTDMIKQYQTCIHSLTIAIGPGVPFTPIWPSICKFRSSEFPTLGWLTAKRFASSPQPKLGNWLENSEVVFWDRHSDFRMFQD